MCMQVVYFYVRLFLLYLLLMCFRKRVQEVIAHFPPPRRPLLFRLPLFRHVTMILLCSETLVSSRISASCYLDILLSCVVLRCFVRRFAHHWWLFVVVVVVNDNKTKHTAAKMLTMHCRLSNNIHSILPPSPRLLVRPVLITAPRRSPPARWKRSMESRRLQKKRYACPHLGRTDGGLRRAETYSVFLENLMAHVKIFTGILL